MNFHADEFERVASLLRVHVFFKLLQIIVNKISM